MKQVTKRLLALALSCCLLLCASPFAFAADNASFKIDNYWYEITSTNPNEVKFVRPNDAVPSPYTGEVTVPSSVTYENTTYSVTGIGTYAFNESSVTNVTLPNTIKEIGSYAFYQCKSLTSVNVPSKVSVIQTGTFLSCSSLTDLTISGTITKIESSAFVGCSKLENFTIPNTVTSIGANAFQACGATSLVIPAGVTEGLAGALGGCNLDVVAIESGSPYTLDGVALYKNKILECVLDKKITSLTVLGGTTAIGAKAFCYGSGTNGCTNLTNVSIPDSVTSIGDNAFNSCTSLKNVNLPSGLTTIGESAFKSTALETVIIPDGVTSIPKAAFSSISTLKLVVIPASVTSIGQNAFSGWKSGATDCVLVIAGRTVPSFNNTAFGSNANLSGLTVLVPSDAVSSYQSVTQFSDSTKVTVSGYALSVTDETARVDVGETLALPSTATIPTGAKLSVTSDAETVATATKGDDGKTITINGVGPGDATITAAITVNGYTLVEDTCEVKALAAGGTFETDPTGYVADGYIVRKDSDTSYTVVAKENLTSGVYMSDPSGSVASGYVVSGSGPYTVSVYIPTTTTTTTTNDDGSKTTTTTNKSTGATTETTTSQPVTDEAGNTTQTTTETVTQKDGSTTETVTETVKAADGSTTETVTETATDKDGVTTSTETVTTTDTAGTTATKVTETNAAGEATTTITAAVSDKAVEEAAQEETPVTLPVEVTAAAESEDATAITVQVPASVSTDNTVKVEIPVENLTSGTVAVIVNEDGTEEIVKTSTLGEEGVVLTLEGDATVKIVDNSKIFEDVHPVDHWAEDAVTYVAAREIFNGTGTSERNTFSPDEDLTRAMLMTVLARYDGQDTTGGETWYEQGMNWAMQTGVSDGTNPDVSITREEMVTMIWRYAGKPESSHALAFSDAHDINDWAETAMRWAVSTGIINGVGNNTLDPRGPATRAQVATVMMRFCEKINK